MSTFVDGKWAETTDVDAANLNSASVPVGGIIMYSGTIADLPTNWELCDGTDGTPDLRGRFIVGAEGTYTQGDTGGSDDVTLTTANLPSHTHDIPYRENPSTSHTHDGTTSSMAQGGTGGDWTTTLTDVATLPEGSGTAHENRPPFYALAYVMRVA